MTEAEWLGSDEPKSLFRTLNCRLRHRKLRLFAVACCHRISHQLSDKRSLTAIAVAERYADGNASDNELHIAHESASTARRQAYDVLAEKEERVRRESGDVYRNMAKVSTGLDWAVVQVADPVAWKAAESVSWMAATPRGVGSVTGAEYPLQANLIRDIFGNPFHHVTVDPVWLTWNNGAVPTLAQSIYENRTFERLPDLAGVLEAAGCRDTGILAHCRHAGPHVRGCWMVDAILGKS